MNYIWITTSFEGFHYYEDAPEEVGFLRNLHRHVFHVKVFIEVFRNDRDIEFILFKRFVDRLIQELTLGNNKSCEMIADELAGRIRSRYPRRKLIIEVSEDNENGVRKEYDV